MRFTQMTPKLFRSGEATSSEEYEAYTRAGIKTIIDLRTGPAAEVERKRAGELGFKYVNIPLHQHSTPDEYLRAETLFFQTIDNPANGKVVFHCKHGKDRTGYMAAIYRVIREHWTPEAAIAEWKAMGGYDAFWGNTIQTVFNQRVKFQHPLNCFEIF